jgi:hypothetical protein
VGNFGKKQKPVESASTEHPDAPVDQRSGPDLLRSFTAEDYERALDDWKWLGLDGLSPIAASPFGDVFFRGRGGIWFLDTLEGSVTQVFGDEELWRETLETPEGQDQYLLAGLALGAASRGLVPGPSQVYAFSVPPVLGGAIDATNMEVLDFVVAVSMSGQVHHQVRDLPPGTTISGFTLDGN